MAIIPRYSVKVRENYHWMAETFRELEWQLRGRIDDSGLIPREWEELSRQRGPMPKVRVTFWVEGDVVKFFRGMGKGHTARMALVLRAYKHARLADVLRGAAGVDYDRLGLDELSHRTQVLVEYMAVEKELMDAVKAERAKGSERRS